jgi:hypothetical protein
MSSSKRKRSEEDHVVTIQDAAAAIGKAASTWVDPCGVSLFIKQRLKHERNKILYQLMTFDSLLCTSIHSILDINLPGDFMVQSLFCVAETRSIDITIVRRQIETMPAVMHMPADLTAEITRMRIATIVAAEDVQRVKDGIASLLRALPASASWTIIAQPNVYCVSFTKVLTLAGSAATIASRLSPGSTYDFENASLLIYIKKAQPEMTF